MATDNNCYVFRRLHDPINAAIVAMAKSAARAFQGVEVTVPEAIDLAIPEADRDFLARAKEMLSQRLVGRYGSEHHEYYHITLNVDGVPRRVILTVDSRNNPRALPTPNYLHGDVKDKQFTLPSTADPAVVARIVEALKGYYYVAEMCGVMKLAWDTLDTDLTLSRENIRYAFPGIVPLLKRVAKREGTATAVGEEAQKWANNLSTTNQRYFWSPRPWLREALPYASDAVARCVLLGESAPEAALGSEYAAVTFPAPKNFRHLTLKNSEGEPLILSWPLG